MAGSAWGESLWGTVKLACEEAEVNDEPEIENGSYSFDINSKNSASASPLHLAAEKGNLDCVQLLLSRGVVVTGKDHKGQRPLHLAAMHGNLDCARALIDSGAAPHRKNKAGNAVLHVACSLACRQVPSALGAIEQSSRIPPACSRNQRTAPHRVASFGE